MTKGTTTDLVTCCPDCGGPLVNVKYGAVCTEGHGKIYPRLPDDVQDLNARRIKYRKMPPFIQLQLVRAERGEYLDRYLYLLDGRPGLWRRLPATAKPAKEEGREFAQGLDLVTVKPRWFERQLNLELEMAAALKDALKEAVEESNGEDTSPA